eukprot:270567-Amphidinium_carterae.1
MLQQALLLGGTAGPRRARNRPARPGRAERERQQHALQKVWSCAAAELGRADVSGGQSTGSQIHDAAQGAGAAPQSKSDAESWCEVDAETSKVSLLRESVTDKETRIGVGTCMYRVKRLALCQLWVEGREDGLEGTCGRADQHAQVRDG